MAHWTPSLLGALIFWTTAFPCVAFPTGAPASACKTMKPIHMGVHSQPHPAPYELLVWAHSFTNGWPITVQVLGPEYRGLLLEARMFGSTAALGTWQSPPNNTRFLQCSGNPQGAVTHSNMELKTSLATYTWLPLSSGCPPFIAFIATVAHSRETYWLNIKSKILWRDPTATCGTEKFTWTATTVIGLLFHLLLLLSCI
ncbi:putative defense protein 3 [Alligator mississippiensis]|uniref:putative defense protein 3 n=1 Tax=Alligator mississippiensis TaxID=8496 RepID=UPI00071139C0|nr:putative defense protein 3 [Alligator mississippiensis]